MNKLIKWNFSAQYIYVLIFLSGFATLSWEVIWQIKSSLALGVSAWGTALTLIVIMGGMSAGGFLMSQMMRQMASAQIIFLYGLLEFIIGLIGLFLNIAFHVLEKLDSWVYLNLPNSVAWTHIIGIGMILLVPALCMGATFPVFGLIAKQKKISVAKLYGINTIGAAVGVLFVALLLIPVFGVAHTMWVIAGINMMIGVFASLMVFISWNGGGILMDSAVKLQDDGDVIKRWSGEGRKEIFIVFITGFATFILEIAWFRSLSSTFTNTSDVFAIMLASLIIVLGMAANNVPKLKQKNKTLSTQLNLASIFILLITPVIERFDLIIFYPQHVATRANQIGLVTYDWLLNPDTFAINGFATFGYLLQTLILFFIIYLLISLPMRFLGTVFPWLVDNQFSSRRQGGLYAVNTLASILGVICAAWLLLPTIGFAKTAWLAGLLVMVAGMLITPKEKQLLWASLCTLSFVAAFFFSSNIGITRAQGFFANTEEKPAKVLAYAESPLATTSVVEYQDGTRALLINSASAAGESGKIYRPATHYTAWMGHLPMLLHADPKNALVICFGTGQTANAVRKENPQALDVVDVNADVFKFAHYFRTNENVLHDQRVTTLTMDGRAYLRRTKKMYDVITLEPMPPTFDGVNALYSIEFYQLAYQRLTKNGVIAQWLPLHMIAPQQAASIAKTFITVFPNTILWIDPVSRDGILLGTKTNDSKLGSVWPGFTRTVINRNLTLGQVRENVVLDENSLKQYGSYGEIITDDNQLLAYGKALYVNAGMTKENFRLLTALSKRHI